MKLKAGQKIKDINGNTYLTEANDVISEASDTYEISDFNDLKRVKKGIPFTVSDRILIDNHELDPELKYTVVSSGNKVAIENNDGGKYWYYPDSFDRMYANSYDNEIDSFTIHYLHGEKKELPRSRSGANEVVLPYMIEYMTDVEPVELNMFMGSYAYNMGDWLFENHPELFENRHTFSRDFDVYGKEWYKPTVRVAVDTVKGKGFFNEWEFVNSKDSLRKEYHNPKFFHYENDKIVYNESMKENTIYESFDTKKIMSELEFFIKKLFRANDIDDRASDYVFEENGKVMIDCERENSFVLGDYSGEFRRYDPWISPELEKWVKKNDLEIDWRDAGTLYIYTA